MVDEYALAIVVGIVAVFWIVVAALASVGILQPLAATLPW